MKKILIALTLIIAQASAFAQATWNIDKAHTQIKFAVTHMMISEVEGEFKTFDATVTSSKPDFTDAQINFTIDVNSITTGNDMRDNHLKSDDFFNVQQYPQITFKSVSFNKVDDKKYQLVGDLTIRDVTKRVTFDVTYNGSIKDQKGNAHAGFKATTTINRLDYNLKWNKLIESGGAVVSSDVEVTVNIELVQPQS